MKLICKTKIGSEVFEAEGNGKNFKESIWQLAPIINAPEKCGLCGGDIKLETTKRKHIFTKIRCKKCGAFSGLGEYEDGSGFWWKDFLPKDKEFKDKE